MTILSLNVLHRHAAHLMKSVVHIYYMSLKIYRKILLASWLINEMLLLVRKLDNYSCTTKVVFSLDSHRTDFTLSCPIWRACTCWTSSSGQKVRVGWNKVMGLRRAETGRSRLAFIILYNLSRMSESQTKISHDKASLDGILVETGI